MNRKAKNPNYVTFGPTETVVTCSRDRGQLRRNDMGEFFMREFTDGRFTCASPDLERALIDAGVRAGFPMGIIRTKYGSVVIWKVRRVAEVVPIAASNEPVRHTPAPSKAVRNGGFPPAKYSDNQPPAPVFPEAEPPAPVRVTAARPSSRQHVAPTDSLLSRCLFEAVDASIAAQQYAQSRGYAVAFSAAEVERIGVSIFIERTRNGAVYAKGVGA